MDGGEKEEGKGYRGPIRCGRSRHRPAGDQQTFEIRRLL